MSTYSSSSGSSSISSKSSYCIQESDTDNNSGNISEAEEIFLGVQPYLFDPEYETMDELMEEVSVNADIELDSLEPIVESRAGKLDWC